MEGISCKGDQNNLKKQYACNDSYKYRVLSDSLEAVNLIMDFSAVYKVKDLHHDKSVKKESEMTRVDVSFLVYSLIVTFSIKINESSTSDGTAIFIPFPFRVVLKHSTIVGVFILWNKLISCKYKNQQDYKLKNRLSDDMLEHCFRYDMLASFGWLPI